MISEMNPLEVWAILKADENAILIDVRTPEEWSNIGFADLSLLGKEAICLSIQNNRGELNSNFVSQLYAYKIKSWQPLFFICKSGKRSNKAAEIALKSGFEVVINVQDGFEGASNENKVDNKTTGWLSCGLPFKFPD